MLALLCILLNGIFRYTKVIIINLFLEHWWNYLKQTGIIVVCVKSFAAFASLVNHQNTINSNKEQREDNRHFGGRSP